MSEDKIPANIRDSVKAIESRRQIESTRGDVPLLEQTEFGKLYLNKRINVLTNDLNERYNESLTSGSLDMLSSMELLFVFCVIDSIIFLELSVTA